MSNVLARDRGLSSLSFYTHLEKLMNKAEAYLGDPKRFTSKEYYTYCSPILRTLGDVLQNVIVANSIYPTSSHETMIRRDYQNIAIGLVEAAKTQLQRLILNKGLSIDNGTKPNELIKDLKLEVQYLKWWRKMNNSLMRKFGDQSSTASRVNTENSGAVAATARLGVKEPTKPIITAAPPFGSGKQCKPGTICPISSMDMNDDSICPPPNPNASNNKIKPLIKKNIGTDTTVEDNDNKKSSTSTKKSAKKPRQKAINFFDLQPIANPTG